MKRAFLLLIFLFLTGCFSTIKPAKQIEDNQKAITKEEKKVIYKAMHRNIADMESDGVYFDNSLKEIVENQIDTLGKDGQKPVSEVKEKPSK